MEESDRLKVAQRSRESVASRESTQEAALRWEEKWHLKTGPRREAKGTADKRLKMQQGQD